MKNKKYFLVINARAENEQEFKIVSYRNIKEANEREANNYNIGIFEITEFLKSLINEIKEQIYRNASLSTEDILKKIKGDANE